MSKFSGNYIVIDGIDGGGKGVLFEALSKEFPTFSKGEKKFCYTREPGGLSVGEKIREILLHDYVSPRSEFFLFLAQRKELRDQLIAPTLLKGVHVISDRSDSSTFAYQIRGRNTQELEGEFWATRETFPPLPTLYVFLDLDPKIAAERLRQRKEKGGDRFDNQDLEFFIRVRNGFIEFSKKVTTPCLFVDASQEKEKVAQVVINYIREHIM